METLRHHGTWQGACRHAQGLEEQAVLLLASGERLPHPVTAWRCPGAWREASGAAEPAPAPPCREEPVPGPRRGEGKALLPPDQGSSEASRGGVPGPHTQAAG